MASLRRFMVCIAAISCCSTTLLFFTWQTNHTFEKYNRPRSAEQLMKTTLARLEQDIIDEPLGSFKTSRNDKTAVNYTAICSKVSRKLNAFYKSHSENRKDYTVSQRYRQFEIDEQIAFYNIMASLEDHYTDWSVFRKVVVRRANAERIVFIAVFDSKYAPMAGNLFATSFAPLNITNYLFVGSDPPACDALQRQQLAGCQGQAQACVTTFLDKHEDDMTTYGGRKADYNVKTIRKTVVMLEALRLGLNPILVDVDIVFLKNPLPHMNCTECNIEVVYESPYVDCTGFYMARSSRAAVELHERAIVYSVCKKTSQQPGLNDVGKWMRNRTMIKWGTLSQSKFPGGNTYYEGLRVMFHEDRAGVNESSTIVIHNTFVYTTAAKVYRFKETGMWMVDTDGYYSDPSRQYILYDNPIDFGPTDTLKAETEALHAALMLGLLLNRTVILPVFHCHGCRKLWHEQNRCALSAFYSIVKFDAQFLGAYREHSFLSHPHVPEAVKLSISPKIVMKGKSLDAGNNKYMPVIENDGENFVVHLPNNIDWLSDLKCNKIVEMFAKLNSYSVLHFQSLYDLISPGNAAMKRNNMGASNGCYLEKVFGDKLNMAFVKSDYRQFSQF